MEGPETASEAAPRLIICGGGSPIEIPLSEGETTIGRSEQNSIQIHQTCISFHHLTIVRTTGNRYRVWDSGSRNGTTVNGVSIGSCLLNDGDVLALGRAVTIHFLHLSEHPEGVNEPELREYMEMHERILHLAEEQQLLKRSIRKKTAEYESLLNSIVALKQNPESAFRRIYGDGEVHFPVNFPDRMAASGALANDGANADDLALLS